MALDSNDIAGVDFASAPIIVLTIDLDRCLSQKGLYLSSRIHDSGEFQQLTERNKLGVDFDFTRRVFWHTLSI